MRNCLRWPLLSSYKPLNFDFRTSVPSAEGRWFGPAGPANTSLAWVVFNLEVEYDGAHPVGSFVEAFYQRNPAEDVDDPADRVRLAVVPTDVRSNVPIIGGGAFLENFRDPAYGQARPLYVRFPDQILITFLGFPVNTDCRIRGLALEVPHDVDVSAFL